MKREVEASSDKFSFSDTGRNNKVIQLDFPGKILFLTWIDSFSSMSVTQVLQSVKTISHMTHPFHGLFPETLSVAQKELQFCKSLIFPKVLYD